MSEKFMRTAQSDHKPSLFARLFITHPASVGESYGEHFMFALQFAGLLLLAASAAFVHAIIPAFQQKTASRIIKRLYTKMENRHNT